MLVVRKSRIKGTGRGLFTTSRIRKGDFIVEYVGERMSWRAACKKYKGREEELLYLFMVNEKICIDAHKYPDALASLANDADGTRGKKKYENNCEYRIKNFRPYIVATKDIKPNTEILVQYGDEYWEAVWENTDWAEEQKKKEKAKKAKKKAGAKKAKKR